MNVIEATVIANTIKDTQPSLKVAVLNPDYYSKDFCIVITDMNSNFIEYLENECGVTASIVEKT